MDTREVKQSSLRAAIGIVPQDTVLFNDSILYNIRYGRPGASDQEVFEAARAAHIHGFIESLPPQYETPVREPRFKLPPREQKHPAKHRPPPQKPPPLILAPRTPAPRPPA